MEGARAARYRRGDPVRLRGNPRLVGRVDSEPIPYAGGWMYGVFFGGADVRHVPESELEPAPAETDVTVVPRETFLRALLLAKVRYQFNDVLYTYQASRTIFEPYQFKPALKYLDALVPGILIADEVGMGKTIEAAILFQELHARTRLRRVLVVCPAGLRAKWHAELATRFGEQFSVLGTQEILRDIDAYNSTEGAQPLRGIVGLETIRSRRIQNMLEENPVRYDLVIVDEAHHMRTSGRLSHRIGQRLSDLTDHLILLTATPLQLGRQDLFNLLQLIDETQFSSPADFALQLEPNRYLNAAIEALRRDPPDANAALRALTLIRNLAAGRQVTAHPNYAPVLHALHADYIDRESAVRLQREINAMNVLSSVFTRTRKRDVTRIVKRSANVLRVSMTKSELAFYQAVLNLARAQARSSLPGELIPAFAGIMRERQAASCLAAAREYLLEIGRDPTSDLGAEASAPELEIGGEDGTGEDEILVQLRALAGDAADGYLQVRFDSSTDARALASYLKSAGVEAQTRASTVSVGIATLRSPRREHQPETDVQAAFEAALMAAQYLGSVDSKFATFRGALENALAVSRNNKAIVFSTFRRTLNYLERELRNYGYGVVQINGDVTPDDRRRVIEEFRLDPKLQVLLASEVGAEGIDLQFCDTLFNYDLPWNPMRVEQRIGRIDRYGQESRQVRVYSLFLADTIEERILERLYDRIGVFRDSIGDLEPVLGSITRELTQEIFTKELSPQEERELATQYTDMLLHRAADARELEAQSSALLAHEQVILDAIHRTIDSGRYISAAELKAVVTGFLQAVAPTASLDFRDDENSAVLRGNDRLAIAVDEHLAGEGDFSGRSSEFLRRLTKGERIPVTFDGENAIRGPGLELLSMYHPLVRAAIQHERSHAIIGPAVADLIIENAKDIATSDPVVFGLFVVRIEGAQRQTKIVPIVLNSTGERVSKIEERLLRLIQDEAEDAPYPGLSDVELDRIVRETTARCGTEADRLKEEALERNEAILQVRKGALERTFGAKIKRRREQVATAKNERIRRLWEGEIRNLGNQLRRRLEELEASREVSVSSVPIGFGRLRFVQRTRVERQSDAVPDTHPTSAPAPTRPTAIGPWPEPPVQLLRPRK